MCDVSASGAYTVTTLYPNAQSELASFPSVYLMIAALSLGLLTLWYLGEHDMGWDRILGKERVFIASCWPVF